jgi:hypothetical protein
VQTYQDAAIVNFICVNGISTAALTIRFDAQGLGIDRAVAIQQACA